MLKISLKSKQGNQCYFLTLKDVQAKAILLEYLRTLKNSNNQILSSPLMSCLLSLTIKTQII